MTARSLGTRMARAFKFVRRPRKNKTTMASLFRNIARKNFNCLEAGNVRSLLSTGHRFVKRENVTLVTSHLSESVDPHKRESHRKQSSNSLYSLFAVLGIAAASSNDTEEKRFSAYTFGQ